MVVCMIFTIVPIITLSPIFISPIFISPIFIEAQSYDDGMIFDEELDRILGDRIVCIDPDHGGRDPRALGIDGEGYPDEKDFNLDVTLKLRNLLEADGATVVMTRITDEYLSLQERCDIANDNDADIFISIHCNSNHDPTAHGTETY